MNTEKKKMPNLVIKKIKRVIYEFEDDSRVVINDGQKYFDTINEYSVMQNATSTLAIDENFTNTMREIFKTSEGSFYTKESLDEWNEYKSNMQ